MARSGVNKVILVGNLGADPDVRYTPNGSAVTSLSVATSDSWIDKNTNQKQERTEWHRVVLFGKLAEIAGQYLKKGSKVYLEGKLQTRKWQDQQGQDRYTTEVVVDGFEGQMQMLDSRPEGGYQGSNQSGGYQQQGGGYNAPAQNTNQYGGGQNQNYGGPQGSQQPSGQSQQQWSNPQQAPQQPPQQQAGQQQSQSYQAPQQNQQRSAPPQQQPQQPQQSVAAGGFDDFDDDIPF